MMRKGKMESVASSSIIKRRSIQAIAVFSVFYIFVLYNMPFNFIYDDIAASQSFPSSSFPARKLVGDVITRTLPLEEQVDFAISAPARPRTLHAKVPVASAPASSSTPSSSSNLRALQVSGLVFQYTNATGPTSELDKVVRNAWETGIKVFTELKFGKFDEDENDRNQTMEKCPHSMVMSELEFIRNGSVLELPCGLTLGSHITLMAKPNKAHPEITPKIAIPKEGNQATIVSQFMIELQGLKTVDGEDPPRILHFNPRLKGDWSGKPMIELNTCYRMQWGIAHRCDGWKSRADEETVDGLVKCEKWIRDDDDHSEESKTKWWLNRLISGKKMVQIEWPYPFVEEKIFVLTLSAGLEGYHVNVDGRHIASFPYRTGFVLEDATGLSVSGDIQVQSVFSGSLPTTHPTFSPLKHLEISSQWQAPPLPPDGAVELFIGILSAGNHFAERMAVRKSWMQSIAKSPNMVARFFVAMHGRKKVNVDLKREAEFFGDIIIVPFMDSYDLVVLKTVAICEYGARVLSAKHIMKCDDDTFVKIDSVMMEVKKVAIGNSLYLGNINFHHKPLRNGKWSVTYEEWSEEDYPSYANGPGYVISSDIAHFIISDFEKHTLRLFKMEDVSMGMWIEQFNNTRPVQYIHDLRFCQFGCFDGYFTAHYQSPRQMICMWDKLKQGKTECCNF